MMLAHDSGNLSYGTFEIFTGQPVVHGIFTRQGGVSPSPWHSLNTATSVGDSRENILQNRKRILEVLGRPFDSVFDVWQVHSDRVVVAENPRPIDTPYEKADGIITNRPELTLFMRFADCVPILMYDPVKKVIALVHAGWKGTVAKIAGVALQKMQGTFGCRPADILAGIGPSIGPDHYEVGSEVADLVRKAFMNDQGDLLKTINGSSFLDLWEANRVILADNGVKNIEISGVCTACDTSSWFSHRAEQGKTGRFGAVLALSSGGADGTGN